MTHFVAQGRYTIIMKIILGKALGSGVFGNFKRKNSTSFAKFANFRHCLSIFLVSSPWRDERLRKVAFRRLASSIERF